MVQRRSINIHTGRNPFYIHPAGEFSQGLAGLTDTLDYTQRREAGEQERIEKKERATKATEAAIEAYKTNDPDKIAEAILNFPEIAETLGPLYDKRRDYDKENYINALEADLTEIEKTGTLTAKSEAAPLPNMVPKVETAPLPGMTPKVKTISIPDYGGSNGSNGSNPAEFGMPGKPGSKLTSKIDVLRSIYAQDPEAGKRALEYDFAKLDPKGYEKWKDIYRPEDKEAAPSSLKKMIDERQALLDEGILKDDPRIIAYDDKISGRESTPAPSNLKKMMTERDELIAEGADSKNPDIIAYNNKIFGEMADKKYSPSPLKKLIKERAEYLEEGEDPDYDIIRAYNNKIAGIDIDIEELTQDEIDMWGAWINLTGKMPSVGRGKQATKIRAALLKSAAAQALGDSDKGRDPNKTPAEAALQVVGTQADTKSIQGSLNFLEKQLGSMGSFIQNMDAQITKVSSLAEDLKTFDVRIMNVPLRFVRAKIVGSPLQAKYDMYLTEIEQEIGRLAAGASASIAELSTGAQERWDKIHDKNLSVKDMLSLLKETRHAADLRLQSVEDQLNRTRSKLRTRDYGGTEAYPEISSQEAYDDLKSGDIYINQRTGKQMRKP